MGRKATLVIRNLFCAAFAILLSGAFAIPAQAQSEKISISSLQVTTTASGQRHTVSISGSFTTTSPKQKTRLDLVTFGPIQSRSELAEFLADSHLNKGTVHPEISVLLQNPVERQSNSWSLQFDGDKALDSPVPGVYVFGVVKRGSSLQTNFVQPWFYGSKQIKKTKVVFLTQIAVQNSHLADGKTEEVNNDALTLVRLNNLLEKSAQATDLVKDPAVDSWLTDLQNTALKPAADEVATKLLKATSKSATQIYNHTDLQSLFIESPNDIWSILRLTPRTANQPVLYFPKYGQINSRTLAQLENFDKIVPVLSNTFVSGDQYRTTSTSALVNNKQSLVYDAAISRCLSRKDSMRAIECFAANTAMITAESPYQARTVAVVTPTFWDAQSSELAQITNLLAENNWAELVRARQVLGSKTDLTFFNITGKPKEFSAGLVAQGKQLIKKSAILGNAVQNEEFSAGFELARLRSFSEQFPKAKNGKYFLEKNLALLERVRSNITIQTSKRITVASAKTDIPLTISNESGYPIQVKANVTSPYRSRFSATPSELVTVETGTRVTVPVKIHFKGTGSINVTVRLTNAKNQNLGIIQNISVASSSYQSLARTLVWGACGLLVLFAIVNAARKRRDEVTDKPTES